MTVRARVCACPQALCLRRGHRPQPRHTAAHDSTSPQPTASYLAHWRRTTWWDQSTESCCDSARECHLPRAACLGLFRLLLWCSLTLWLVLVLVLVLVCDRHARQEDTGTASATNGSSLPRAADLYWHLVKTSYPLERLAADPDYDVDTKRRLLREFEADFTYDDDFKDAVVAACVAWPATHACWLVAWRTQCAGARRVA